MNDFTIINKTLTLVGKRCSGKSYMLKHIVMHEIHLFSKVFCICPTECVNNFYGDIIPQNCIYEEYSEEWASQLIHKLTIENSNKTKDKQKKVLLILDDLISDINFHQSKTLKTIYSRGRHIGLSVLVTTQHLYSLSPLIRANSDYIFCSQQNRASVELLQSQFMSGNISKQDFLAMYYKYTVDYNFLLINCNTVVDANLNSIYGVIKVPRSEMDIKIQHKTEIKPTNKKTSIWGSIFGEEQKKTKLKITVLQKIDCKKPVINPVV